MFERVLNAILGKKFEIIAILCKYADENGIIKLSIAQICALSNASKPTVINALHFLEQKKVLKKLANKCYQLII